MYKKNTKRVQCQALLAAYLVRTFTKHVPCTEYETKFNLPPRTRLQSHLPRLKTHKTFLNTLLPSILTHSTATLTRHCNIVSPLSDCSGQRIPNTFACVSLPGPLGPSVSPVPQHRSFSREGGSLTVPPSPWIHNVVTTV